MFLICPMEFAKDAVYSVRLKCAPTATRSDKIKPTDAIPNDFPLPHIQSRSDML